MNKINKGEGGEKGGPREKGLFACGSGRVDGDFVAEEAVVGGRGGRGGRGSGLARRRIVLHGEIGIGQMRGGGRARGVRVVGVVRGGRGGGRGVVRVVRV